MRRSYASLAEPIGRLARLAGVPRRTVLLTAFHHTMSLFAERDGSAEGHSVGLVTNGRPEVPGADRMRGLFLNTVPFGVRRPRGSWLEYLKAAFAAEQEMLPHRRVPLARLAQLRPGEPSLADTLFNYVNFHRLSGDSWDDSLEIARTAFPLMLNASVESFTLDVDPDHLAPATAEQLADLMCGVLKAMTARPQAPVTAPVLGGEARMRALEEWGRGPELPNTPLMFHECVAEHAVRTPDAVAVRQGGQEVTYGELDSSVRQLADRLRALGVGPEVPVGICLDRGPEMVRAVLGVLRSGGAFLPLESQHPSDRLKFIARDSGMPVLITQSSLLGKVPFDGPTLVVDDPATWADPIGVPAPAPAVTADNAAYVLYTSGSTGTPKGVTIQHRSLTNMLEGQRDLFPVTPADRVLQFASLSFDVSIMDLTWALANGAQLCTPPREALRAGADLANTLLDYGITVAMLAPSALAALGEDRFPALRILQVAGEACPAELAQKWAGGRRFYNVYGLTETAVWSVSTLLKPDCKRPPIGWPMRNTQVYVLDEDLQPVPVGVQGEVYLGGRAIGRGYVNRPDLTAAAFVPDPYGAPGGRLCRTGDIGVQLPDGAVEVLGRRDSQVKLRGFRIELGEIEHGLRELPEVQQAVVLLRRDLPEPALVAYVVPEAGVEPVVEPFRQALRARVPAYMVPARFVFLDAMPVNSSGKIDKKALPLPSADRLHSATDYVAPGTPAEVVLAEVWRTVLGISQVGVHDDFFALGGSSLSTVRVAAQAAARGVSVSVRDLLELPTIARLAARATEAAAQAAGERPAEAEAGTEAGAKARAVTSEVRLREGDGAPCGACTPAAAAAPGTYRSPGPSRPGSRSGPSRPGACSAGWTRPPSPASRPTTPPRWPPTGARPARPARLVHGRQHRPGDGHPAARGRSHRRTAHADRAVPAPPGGPRAPRRGRPGHGAGLRMRDRVRALAPSAEREAAVAELTALLLGAGMSPGEASLVEHAPIEVWHSLLTALAGYALRPYPGHVHLLVGSAAAELPDGEPMPGLDVDFRTYVERWREIALGGLTVHVTEGDHMSMMSERLMHKTAGVLGRIQSEARR